MSQQIKVILADGQKMFRQALRAMLESQQGVTVVGEAGDGREAVRLAADLAADVVVINIEMPLLNGIDATRQITACGNGPKVIAISGRSGDRSLSALRAAGAAAFISKDADLIDLIAALRSGHAPPACGESAQGGPSPSLPSGFDLSMREREILQLMTEGCNTKQMAALLKIGMKTVDTHRRNVMVKLCIDNLAGLTKYAVREGLTSLDS